MQEVGPIRIRHLWTYTFLDRRAYPGNRFSFPTHKSIYAVFCGDFLLHLAHLFLDRSYHHVLDGVGATLSNER